MGKYYVSCGDFKLVIARQTPILAAMASIRFYTNKKQSDLFFRAGNIIGENMEPNLEMYPDLNEEIIVSEEGFSDKAKIIEHYATILIVKNIMMEDFKNFGKN